MSADTGSVLYVRRDYTVRGGTVEAGGYRSPIWTTILSVVTLTAPASESGRYMASPALSLGARLLRRAWQDFSHI